MSGDCRVCGKRIEKRANDPRPGYVWYAVGDPTPDASYCGTGTAPHVPAAAS